MKIKTFILTFLMIMSGSILFGQNSANVANEKALKDAIAAGQFGEMSITLTDNLEVTERINIPVGYTITINLNGKTITANEDIYAFNNLGALTIKDDVGTGGIEARGIYNGASNPDGNTPVLKIEGGIFKNNATNGGAAIYNYSEVIITGGEFYGEYAAITNRGSMQISNAFIEGLNYAAIVNLGELTYGNGVYMVGDLVDNYEGTTGTVISGEAIPCVARINNTSYASFGEALTAAKATTGDVTVQIYDAVEFVNGMELKGGNYTSITFIGKSDDAKMTINQSAGGDYIEAHGKTVAFENIALAKANPQWSGNSGHMGNYFSIQGGTATYTNCTFLNGACTSGGTATYNNCTFKNESQFGLWVYDDALVTVNNSVVDSYKGIKVYSEGETSVTSTLKVENTTFTSKLARPAVAIGYAVSVELIGNTYNNTTDVIELDSGADADCEGITFVAQDANGNDIASTLTAVDRSKDNARCGVLMDGKKIYTSVATAAAESEIGNTITLLYTTDETVELPAGVALDLNNYSAPNVTIKKAGTLGKCYISQTDVRTRIYGEITGMLSVKESVVVDLYSGETKLATTTLAKSEYLTSNTLGVNIVIAGEASSSWNTEWHVAPIAHMIPNKAVLYLDGEKMNDAEVTLGTIDDLGEPYVWGALRGVKPSPAMIGYTGYATLQDAINAAVNGNEIKLYETLEENVTVPQAPDVAITINGNSQNYRGTITVDGKSATYVTAAVIIKNFKFNAYSISKDAVINLGDGTNATRYICNLTVDNCSFTGNEANKDKVAVKSYTGGDKGLTITNCTATGMHSLVQTKNNENTTIANCTITKSGSGVSLDQSTNVNISGCTMDVEKYGIRVNAGSKTTTEIEDCSIKAYIPVMARNATSEEYTFEFNGNNTMTLANPDGKFCVIDGGKHDYEDGNVSLDELTAPTGFVMVELNDANLKYEGVYGGHTHEAKIGDTRYVFLQEALNAVEAGEQPTTIEIIRDVTSDVTVSQVEGENIIIDGNGLKFSGTIYIDGNSRSTGTETLIIQDFNFTTEEDSHDFISANTTDGETRYAHNVTVKKCNFTATEESTAVVGLRLRQAYNIAVENCTSNHIFSLMWSAAVDGLALNNVTVENCTEGITISGGSKDVTITDFNITSPSFGIRASIEGGQFTMTDSNIDALVPVVVRNDNGVTDLAQYTLSFTFDGTNNITENNPTNYWFVAGENEYKGADDVMPTAPKGNIIVNLNDNGLLYDDVYGNFAVAKIGYVQYSTFAAALEAAQDGATIELIYEEGDAPIAMNGALYGKNVTVTGTAKVDWSKGWLFIGRGGEGDAQLTFNKANLTSASDTRKYGINVSGKAADGHADNGTLRIEDHSNIEVDYIITRNRLVVVGASTLTAKNGFVLGGRPAEETGGNDATASVFLTNNAHIIVKGNKTTIGYEGKATIDLSTGGTSFKCYDHDVTITEKGIVNLDGATFNVAATGENAVKLVNNGTVNVKGNSSFDVKTIEGKAIVLNNATLANAYIGGAVNAFGTNNFTGETNVKGLFSVGYNNASAAPVVVNITGNFNGGNVLIGSSNEHVLNLGDAEGERTTANFSVQLGAFGDVNINNADVTYQYAFIRNDFNVINSTMEVTHVNTNIAGNAKVVVDNSTWKAGAYARIGEYDGMFGNADVTLKNGSVMTATNLNIILQEGKTVKVTIEDNSRLEATKLTNQGSIVLAGVDAKVTSNQFDNAPTTTVDYKKVGYVEGSYVVIDKDYVAQIIDAEGNSSLDRRYESFAEAVEAALDGEKIELLWEEGDNAIAMAAALNGKTITVTGDANVDWSKGFLFVGRGDAQGNNADATLIFDYANLTSEPANSSTGLNVSGYEIDEEEITNRTGNVIMNNSNIVVEYLLNAGNITLNNTTLTVNDGFRISGRTAEETQDVIGTATFNLFNSTVIVDNMNGMPIGYKGIGIMNIDANSTLQCLRDYGVADNGIMNVYGTVEIAEGKKLTNNGEININGANVSVTSIANAGTINVTGASVLNATVTGEGSVNMSDVALAKTTNLNAVAVVFDGENNINGATIETAGKATVATGKLAVNEGSKVKFNSLEVNQQLSVTNGQLRVTTDFVNNGITSFNREGSDVYVYGATTNNNVLNISNKAVYETGKFENNSENLNVSANSKLQVNGAATFVENSISKIAGEVSVGGSVTQAENAVIRLTEAAAKFTTANTELNVVTTVADSKVVYTDGAYVVVAKQYLAKIDDNQYETLQDAFDAAETGAIIVLFNDNVSVIPMNANLYGKEVTITTEDKEVTVDWNTNGNYWLFVGRGGEGNATLTFDKAKLTSVSNNGGIHVSGREKETANKYDGTLIIKDSDIQLTEFINRNVVTVENSTVTTTLLTSHGRPANETESGEEDATATFTLTNSTLNAQKITNGNEGIGIMNVDAQSAVEVSESLNVTAKGKLYSAGNITGEITKAEEGTIQLTGGIYTTEPQEGWCAEHYGAFPYDETSWIVREVYGTQTIALQAGWNWMSSYISEFDTDGLTWLKEDLSGQVGAQIKNNLHAVTNYEQGWFGSLKNVSVKEMYKVKVTADASFTHEGSYVNYDECEIVLYPGWNYISYPVNEEMNLSYALAKLQPSSNDIIKTQDATATYVFGAWRGDLTTLTPGQGYMYKNASDEIKSFYYTTKKTTSTDSNNRSSKYWTVDATQYPSNMTMIAMTDVEGGDYEVAAFVNGELRGSSRPVYVEELDAHILILTISGDEVAEVTFKYYDIATGEEVAFSNRINYTNDAIIGSMDEPYMLTRGTTGIGEAAMSQVNIYPNPTTTGTEINLQTVCDTVEVFNALGVKVAEYQNVDSIDALETAGIYVIRITNDGNVQNCRLVVK